MLYIKSTGHGIGALATTPADLPSLEGIATLEVPVRVDNPAVPKAIAPNTLVFDVGELVLASVETEFTDPIEIFDWRVVETKVANGLIERRLEQSLSGGVTATRMPVPADTTIEITVNRIGIIQQLEIEVRTATEQIATRKALFPTTDPVKVTVPSVPTVQLTVLVEGYKPVIVPRK